MRTLVTGAAGQVGQDLVSSLRTRGDEVYACDVAAQPRALRDDVKWLHLDVTDATAVRELLGDLRPDRVFHLAAILSARGESMPQATYEVNQGGTYHLLEACREHQIRQLNFTSTIAVFGPGLPEVVGDDVPLHPTTMYGLTKVSGELLGAYYQQRYGLDFRGVRFPGLISASLPGGGTSDYALFMYVDGVRKGHYEAFCRPETRIPLMYMPDGVRALLELSEAQRDRLTRCIYNITAFSPTAKAIAETVERALPGTRIGFAPDPTRQGILDSWPRVLDDSNARRDWDWKPRYDLDAMTRDLIPKLRELLGTEAVLEQTQ